MKTFLKETKRVLLISITLLLLCGFAYPLSLTGLGQLVFRDQANGSILSYQGKAIGSSLEGQYFTDSRFMKCRPSAVNYNTYTKEDKDKGTYTGVSSGSKNYGPSNPELAKRVEADILTFLKENPSVKKKDVPTDLLTSSGSGLDPHISPASANIQIPALSLSTGLSKEDLEAIVKNNTSGKLLGIFGEETVNVLKVNLEISAKLGHRSTQNP